jgi:hypothetical protein
MLFKTESNVSVDQDSMVILIKGVLKLKSLSVHQTHADPMLNALLPLTERVCAVALKA